MKNKIIITALTFFQLFLWGVQNAAAIALDVPLQEQQEAVQALDAGLCTGFMDSQNQNCPQPVGEEDGGDDCEDDEDDCEEDDDSREEESIIPLSGGGGEVLGISTTREEVTEKPQPAPAPKTIIQRIETREDNPYALWTLTFLLFTMVFLTLAVIKTEIRLQHIIEHIRSKKRGGRKNTSL